MKIIKSYLFLYLLGFTALWLMVGQFYPQPYSLGDLRRNWIMYTGIMAMIAMSIIMILSVRYSIFEKLLNGLDKSYKLHKYLGIAAFTFSIGHFLWALAFKWMIGWGWFERPARGKPVPKNFLPSIAEWLGQYKDAAEFIGEWSFYVLALLLALSLVKKFPYQLFYQVHRLLPLVYLLLVFHSIVLMPNQYWPTLLGVCSALLFLMGSISAVVSLTQKIGVKRKIQAKVQAITYHPNSQITELILETENLLPSSWENYHAGQFAFLKFMGIAFPEGAHPFTIVALEQMANNSGAGLRFFIKELGDFTQKLSKQIKLNDKVSIEGPYGRFNFQNSANQTQQIWIAGGVGITPFIAKMKQRMAIIAENSSIILPEISLFYSSKVHDQLLLDEVRYLAVKSKVELFEYSEENNFLFKFEDLMHSCADWKNASYWFCGPIKWGKNLNKQLKECHSKIEFHQEFFEMR